VLDLQYRGDAMWTSSSSLQRGDTLCVPRTSKTNVEITGMGSCNRVISTLKKVGRIASWITNRLEVVF
jgi:hypothetical protein